MTHFSAEGSRTAPPELLSTAGKLRVLLTGVRLPRPADTVTPADVGLGCATGHVASVGVAVQTWTVPADRHRATVILFHGYGASASSLVPAAAEFHALGCDAVLVDFRGSGGSGGSVTTIGYREADDVAAVVAAVRPARPGEPTVLCGQSMGAAAILRAVGRLGVRADGLLLESPYDRLRTTAANRFASIGLPAFPAADVLVFWGGVQQGFWAAGLNPVDFATSVRCPTVVFHGQLDPRVTAAQARSVYDALAGPKQFELYPTAGHCGFRQADPGRWRATVAAFVDRLR